LPHCPDRQPQRRAPRLAACHVRQHPVATAGWPPAARRPLLAHSWRAHRTGDDVSASCREFVGEHPDRTGRYAWKFHQVGPENHLHIDAHWVRNDFAIIPW